jgi:hypothetical protein
VTVREFISTIDKPDDILSICCEQCEICSAEFSHFINEADLTNLSIMAGNLKEMIFTDRFVYSFSRLADFEIEENSQHVRSIEVVREEIVFPHVKSVFLLENPRRRITTYGVTIKGCYSAAQLNYMVYCASTGKEYNYGDFRFVCQACCRW